MAVALASGFGTNLNPTDFAKKSFAAMITRLMPNGQAPLFGLTSMLPRATALQFQHGYWTKTMLFPLANLDAAVVDGVATSFTVASSANIVPGMLLRAQSTGEIVSVTSITNATTIVVVRGVGTVAAAAIANDVNLYCVGNGYEEGSTRPLAQYILPALVTNYTQIFRNSWALTRTAAATAVAVGDSPIAENRQDCAAFHAADIEKAIFFGQKFLGTKNGQPFHMMDGLINTIQTLAAGNVTTAGGTTNFTQLETALDPIFNQTTDPRTANERILFVGGAARKVINNIGRLNGTYQLTDGQTSFGLQFDTFKLTRGTFRMIEHPLFNSNTDWAKMAVAVDLSTFALPYLAGRDTLNEEYGQDGKPVDSGIDAAGGTLTTEVTCEIRNPAANGVIFGLTAAAVG
jgi:hypothetical protein